MTNRKSTKRALLGSVMAMVLCLAMLVGATFAWFTDTASTGVNKIQAGNLDIEIQDENGNAIKNLAWKTQEGTAFDEEQNPLWEPGCTYELTPFQIVNKGNLALKYKIVVTGLEGDSGLLKVITFTYKTADGATFDINQEGHLTAKGTAKASTGLITLTGTMDTAAGNDYMGKELKNITITVTATQDTVESDSFNNQYDKNATYPVADFTSLQKAFEGSGVYNVTDNIDVTGTLKLTGFNALTLDATGKTVSNAMDLWDKEPGDWSLVSARNSSYLTIAGGDFAAKENDCYAADVQDGAKLVIEDGTFTGNIHAVYVFEGTAYIKGGFFSVQQKYPDASKADEFVLNCYDANREAGTAKIIVTGGTFVNFNPADCYAEGAHTNFVADGYKVVSETHGTDVWYTVVAQ
jgi:predicted ribosomally synthesized peptide with SipW-like signal peptide